MPSGRLPAGRADEVRDDEDQRPPAHGVGGRTCSSALRSVSGAAGSRGCCLQLLDDAQHLRPAAARRDHALQPAVVEQGAHPVAVPGQQAGQHGHEIHQPVALQALGGAEIHDGLRSSRNQAVISRSSMYWRTYGRVQPGRHVPVDVADVVAGLVLAQVGQVQAEAIEQAAVVALQQAIQPADHVSSPDAAGCAQASSGRDPAVTSDSLTTVIGRPALHRPAAA